MFRELGLLRDWLMCHALLLGLLNSARSGKGMTTLHVSTSLLLVIVTLLCAGSLWLLVSKFRTKGRDLLVSFFVVAGLGSAWLSLHYPQLAWLIFFATVLLAMLL